MVDLSLTSWHRPGAANNWRRKVSHVQSLRFIDLFAGLGGFHRALESLGHECVFASELNPDLLELYKLNFPKSADVTYGDIRQAKHIVPPHDILCAGFPCQPFSKSGFQLGRDDVRGTLFDEIVWIIERHHPRFVLLENVGNFERHDEGRTWDTICGELERLGYYLEATTHCTTGGRGLLSPHHIGFPQHRERFYCVATLVPLRDEPFAPRERARRTDLAPLMVDAAELSIRDRAESTPTEQQIRCIDHWNAFLSALPADSVKLPSFPIWGDELWATYPFEATTPSRLSHAELLYHAARHGVVRAGATHAELLEMLPSYAREDRDHFEPWKIDFIRKNRHWLRSILPRLPSGWVEQLRAFPPSLRKLEWNCQGEVRDLYHHVLQFRPSGLRVKRMTSSPALVAMTSTQIPFLGPAKRFLSRVEGLRIQGFPDDHLLPDSRPDAFRALGNAVHVGLITDICRRMLDRAPSTLVAGALTPQDKGYSVSNLAP